MKADCLLRNLSGFTEEILQDMRVFTSQIQSLPQGAGNTPEAVIRGTASRSFGLAQGNTILVLDAAEIVDAQPSAEGVYTSGPTYGAAKKIMVGIPATAVKAAIVKNPQDIPAAIQGVQSFDFYVPATHLMERSCIRISNMRRI